MGIGGFGNLNMPTCTPKALSSSLPAHRSTGRRNPRLCRMRDPAWAWEIRPLWFGSSFEGKYLCARHPGLGSIPGFASFSLHCVTFSSSILWTHP